MLWDHMNCMWNDETINALGNNPSEVHSLYSFFLLVLFITFQYIINIPVVKRTLESTKMWNEYVTKSSLQFETFLMPWDDIECDSS